MPYVVQRTNRLTNPSLETNATNWTANGAGTTATRVTTQFYVGAASLQVTVPAVANGGVQTAAVTTGVGVAVTVQARIRGNVGGETMVLELRNQASTVIASTAVTATTGWTLWTATGTTPAGTTSVYLRVNKVAATAHTYFVDAAMLEYSATVEDYFSGATTDVEPVHYDWTGTANASTSTQSVLKVAASLYGSDTPQGVLVTVDQLVAGDEVTVYRVYGTNREPVRGGIEVIPGTVLVLGDVQAPLGTTFHYEAEIIRSGDLFTINSDTLTVAAPGQHVLSDPYATAAVVVTALRSDDTRTNDAAHSLVRPAGRARPIVLYDVRQDDAGSLTVWTRTEDDTTALKALLAAGGPIVSRHRPDVTDFPATEVLFFTSAARARVGIADGRRWDLPFVVVDDPDPGRAVALSTLQDIADAYPGGTLNDIAAGFPGGTLLQLAQFDWS